MKNWYDTIPPHEDIRQGNFDEAVFAADLGDVANGMAAPDYNDPYLFFKKTYLTKGLTSLLGQVHHPLREMEHLSNLPTHSRRIASAGQRGGRSLQTRAQH